ncbi:unnamed protein product [Litomosoides sigmodontis]|uniref:Uncharacterized protein n=1 Tax=Litomosoides sigmodontis TaxID=42156 RepID=A0A3P6UNT5_LITSI|nr:unnamed protein product [Litomosoides sigmodontis]
MGGVSGLLCIFRGQCVQLWWNRNISYGVGVLYSAFFGRAYFMDHLQALIDPSKQFAKDSIRLVKRCTKPDRKGSVRFGSKFLDPIRFTFQLNLTVSWIA